MKKKITLILSAVLISSFLTVPALATGTAPSPVPTSGTYNTTGYNTNTTGNMRPYGTTGNYNTNGTNDIRTLSTNDGNNNSNWGWLGLLGLVGLVGLRRRNPEHS